MRPENHRKNRRPEMRVERQDPVNRGEAGGVGKEQEANGAGPTQPRRDPDGEAARRPKRIGGSSVPDNEIDRVAENEKAGVEIPAVAGARDGPGIDRAYADQHWDAGGPAARGCRRRSPSGRAA